MINPEQFDDVDRRVLADIAEHGWSDIAVFPTEQHQGLPFNYTVGVAELGHPELLVVGMNNHQGHLVLNAAVNYLNSEGRLVPGSYCDQVLEGYRVGVVKVVDPLDESHMMSMAHRFYGEVEAVQIVWPDRNDRFPWHADFEAEYREHQPLAGPWTGAE
jgi:hypothetical protein